MADIALAQGAGEPAAKQLHEFAAAYAESAELRTFLASPAVSMEAKHAVIERMVARLGASKIIRNFLLVLTDHRRTRLIQEDIAAFHQVIRQRQGVAGAQVSSRGVQKTVENCDHTHVVEEYCACISVGYCISRVHGLEKVMAGEMLAFPHNVFGIALNLEEEEVGAVLLGESQELKEGDVVKRTNTIMSVPVGEALVGRVVNPLGQPVDGKGGIATKQRNALERIAPGVLDRQPVREPLQTGIKAIDSMIPIGRRQRELIIGDRQTGKTAVILDTIINQKGGHVICIYCGIGQKRSTIAQVVKTLTDAGAMDYTIVLASSAAEPASLQYIAPYAACAMGEYFRDNKRHAVAFYDDLSKRSEERRVGK